MPRQPEGKLVVKIKKQIELVGGRPFKIVGQEGGLQEIGIPDILACIYGRFVGAEVKLPGEKLRPRQRYVLREIFEAGGVAAVLETVGQTAVLLRLLEKEKPSDKASGLYFVRGVPGRTQRRIL